MEGIKLLLIKGQCDDILFDIGFYNTMNVPQKYLSFYLLYHSVIIWCIFIYILIKNLSESYGLITSISAIALVFSIIFQSFMIFSLYGYRNVLIIPIAYGMPIIFFIICCYFRTKLLAMVYVVFQTIISLVVSVIMFWGQPWMRDGKDLLFFNVFFYYYKFLTKNEIFAIINSYKFDKNTYQELCEVASSASTRAELDNILASDSQETLWDEIVTDIVSQINNFIGIYGYNFWFSVLIYSIVLIIFYKCVKK